MAKVLFVDDELLIINSLKRGLVTEAYESFFAHGGEEALEMLKNHDFHVLVTDMKMPGMNGLELLKRAKELYPNVVRIVLSGYTALPQVLVTVNQGDVFKFLTKPWDLENEFKHVIREAISYGDFLRDRQKKEDSLKRMNEMYQNMLRQYDSKLDRIRLDVSAASLLSKRIRIEIIKLLKQSALTQTERQRIQLLMHLNEFFMDLCPVIPYKTSISSILDSLKEIISKKLTLAYIDIVNTQAVADVGVLEAKFSLVESTLAFIIDQFVEDDDYLRVRLLARSQVIRNEGGDEHHISFLGEFRHVNLKNEQDLSIVLDIINQYISEHSLVLRYAMQGDQLILELDYSV